MKYCIDTNALIDAWRGAYPKDVLPDLWNKFEEMIDDGSLIATEEVFNELNKQDDELVLWAKSRSKLFIPIDEDIQNTVRDILYKYPKMINVKKSKSMADPWVVALAIINKAKVISSEKYQQSKTKALDQTSTVKIPDVCRVFNITCFDVVGFCRDLNLVFHLR